MSVVIIIDSEQQSGEITQIGVSTRCTHCHYTINSVPTTTLMTLSVRKMLYKWKHGMQNALCISVYKTERD